jgi:hypothetical protein
MLHYLYESLQVFFCLLNNPVWKRSLGDVFNISIGVLSESGAGIRVGKTRAERIAHNNFFQRIPLVAAPD